jgi:nucleoid DNA-binding protein
MAKAKAATKSEILKSLAEGACLTRKQAAAVLDGLTCMIKDALGKKGVGVFTIPGLVKLRVVHKPATKARKGINPFTGQETIFKAKPARNVVKANALKALKDIA